MTIQEQSHDIEGGSAQDPTNGTAAMEQADSSNGNAAAEPSHSSTPRPTFERKLSISEQAQSQSTGKFRAPAFLRWIELPFRVKNIQTGVYLEEATGHAMDVAARGPINQTGSFVGSAMIRMASVQAGGPNGIVYGIKASSVLTVGSVIVGVLAGVTMPFVGALVDHTRYRKMMGSVSAFIVVLAVAAQLILNEDTWFAVFIMETIGGYFLIMHQVCTMAYLPDLSHNCVEMGHYTARLMMNQYFIQGIFTLIIIVVSFTQTINNVQTAKLAAGCSTVLGVVLFGYAWTFLFRKRPKLREIPEGNTLLTTGFKQIHVTMRHVFANYRALKWFMIALLFSPEAGAGVVLSIAVTFLTFFVKMDVREIAIVSLVMLFSNIPGAMISKRMCVWINPLNSFRLAELLFATTNAVLSATVTGSTDKDKYLVYFFASLVGLAFGWMFPSQRTLAVALIPKGQETEIMGVISFFGQIVGWLPVFVFTAMNEAGYSMRWGLGSVSVFLMTSFFMTLFCGSFEDAVALVEQSSEDYLADYKRKSGFDKDSFVENEGAKNEEENGKGVETGSTDNSS